MSLSLKKLIAGSAITVALIGGWSHHTYAFGVNHILTLTENSPGGAGPFVGNFVIDDQKLIDASAGGIVDIVDFISFDITYRGTTFTLNDEIGTFPGFVRLDESLIPVDIAGSLENTVGTLLIFAGIPDYEVLTASGFCAGFPNDNRCAGSKSIQQQAAGVPGPATGLIFAAGLPALVWLRRRARRT